MKTPLLVLVVRRGEPSLSSSYAAVLRQAFVGAQWAATTAVPKEVLQPAEFREFILNPGYPSLPQPLVDSAERILAIVLDARSQVLPVDEPNDTERLLVRLVGGETRLRLVNVMLEIPDSLFESELDDDRIVRLGLADLEERDLRLPFLVLHALHNAVRLFTPDTTASKGTKPFQLFFSHAKRDGVPLTTAVLEWMKYLKGFTAFYDTRNLDLDGDIESQLEGAIGGAVVIVFRTDTFDQRYWCQKEVLWAERHGRAVVTVDARWQIEYSPSVVSFDSTPVVRIPDGNLVRIFAAALLEALRIELFRARVSTHTATLTGARVEVVPRCPSLVSLHKACTELALGAGGRSFVVYPNPSLPTVILEAARNIADSCVSGSSVLSLDEFRLVV